eukprot:comp12826_c0_seq1/m.7982 comp12826_c0_seq1/g.7982  ORF comp12826_c0_seq1/g.7982 comp12826_c0_seq1/m.7982 type:complete len:332 (+) comp12826_c0_seq1:382-1377(+)
MSAPAWGVFRFLGDRSSLRPYGTGSLFSYALAKSIICLTVLSRLKRGRPRLRLHCLMSNFCLSRALIGPCNWCGKASKSCRICPSSLSPINFNGFFLVFFFSVPVSVFSPSAPVPSFPSTSSSYSDSSKSLFALASESALGGFDFCFFVFFDASSPPLCSPAPLRSFEAFPSLDFIDSFFSFPFFNFFDSFFSFPSLTVFESFLSLLSFSTFGVVSLPSSDFFYHYPIFFFRFLLLFLPSIIHITDFAFCICRFLCSLFISCLFHLPFVHHMFPASFLLSLLRSPLVPFLLIFTIILFMWPIPFLRICSLLPFRSFFRFSLFIFQFLPLVF